METNSNYVIYGASGQGKVILDLLLIQGLNNVEIVDDCETKVELLGFPVQNVSCFKFENEKKYIIGVGHNLIRKKIALKNQLNYVSAFHPKAIISSFSVIDIGTVVMASSVVNTNVKIGKHCIVNTGAIVEHDCILDDYVHISPNVALAGGVTVGEGSHLGIGAVVIPCIKIGKWVTVGAGAVIINDIPDFAVVVGNPGRIIKYVLNESI